jgi:antitoxin component HigA of HigAB toxin-antitoxin module
MTSQIKPMISKPECVLKEPMLTDEEQEECDSLAKHRLDEVVERYVPKQIKGGFWDNVWNWIDPTEFVEESIDPDHPEVNLNESWGKLRSSDRKMAASYKMHFEKDLRKMCNTSQVVTGHQAESIHVVEKGVTSISAIPRTCAPLCIHCIELTVAGKDQNPHVVGEPDEEPWEEDLQSQMCSMVKWFFEIQLKKHSTLVVHYHILSKNVERHELKKYKSEMKDTMEDIKIHMRHIHRQVADMMKMLDNLSEVETKQIDKLCDEAEKEVAEIRKKAVSSGRYSDAYTIGKGLVMMKWFKDKRLFRRPAHILHQKAQRMAKPFKFKLTGCSLAY